MLLFNLSPNNKGNASATCMASTERLAISFCTSCWTIGYCLNLDANCTDKLGDIVQE